MLIGTAAVMLWYNVPLTLLSCSTVVLTVLFTRFISKKMRSFFVKRQQLLGSVNGTVEEMVSASKTVTAYNYQDEAVRQFSETADQLTRTGIKAEIIGNCMGPVMNMFNNVSFVIVAVFGAWFALKGYITVGVISAFIVYSKQFSRPINELAQLYGQIQTAIAGAERIFSILDEKEEPSGGQAPKQPVQGVIEFKHVNFSYVPGKQIIKDFNLKVESGKKIALVGTTGSGKTTIINLLMRFYEIDSGEILLDGVNIKDLSIHELRNAVGIVLQDTILFTDTVKYNLTYADPNVSMDEIRAAAASSNCAKMIEAWPEGYDTQLLASGTGLSQGQRQLLTIGRAFLSYPQILILDEATSSVDTRTEKNIQDAMVELMKNRTSLIIAHRISTIRDADQIIVMDQGTIVESGTHQELLDRGGVYHELYMTQFAGQKT
jgi:ATP-binding cassette subfamily B multidrug efflux pump